MHLCLTLSKNNSIKIVHFVNIEVHPCILRSAIQYMDLDYFIKEEIICTGRYGNQCMNMPVLLTMDKTLID